MRKHASLRRHCMHADLCHRGLSKSVKSSTWRSSDARPAGPMPPCNIIHHDSGVVRTDTLEQTSIHPQQVDSRSSNGKTDLHDDHAAHSCRRVGCSRRRRLTLHVGALPLATAHIHDVHIAGGAR